MPHWSYTGCSSRERFAVVFELKERLLFAEIFPLTLAYGLACFPPDTNVYLLTLCNTKVITPFGAGNEARRYRGR